MAVQKLIFAVCLLSLLAVGNQRLYFSDSDSDVTVTHPSAFHDEYIDTKSTVQGLDSEPMKGKSPKYIDLEDSGRPVFGYTSDETSSSESSDITDASERSDTSDSDKRGDIFDNISSKAKEFEGKAFREIDKQRKLAKLQARKYWEALRFKIMKEANETNLSAEELKGELRSAKREAKQKWRDLKWKIRNGNDILEELMSDMDGLNPGKYQKRGSTNVDNDTVFSNDSLSFNRSI